jgi:hypothetical protein
MVLSCTHYSRLVVPTCCNVEMEDIYILTYSSREYKD